MPLSAVKRFRGYKIDPELGEQEWLENAVEPQAEHLAERKGAEGAPRGESRLTQARVRKESAQAEIVELELAAKRRELIPAAEVEGRLREVFTACRTKLLAVPSRARQELPHLAPSDLDVIEDLVRESLEDLAAPDQRRRAPPLANTKAEIDPPVDPADLEHG